MNDEAIWTITMCERTMAVLINAFALWVFLTLILLRHYVKTKGRENPMFYTGDPIKDFDAWDAEQERRLARLPECADCGHRIQDDHYYLINDEAICPDCLDSNYRRDTDDFFE